MARIIRGLLSPAQVREIVGRMRASSYADGKRTAGPLGQTLKDNDELAPGSPAHRELAQKVLGILKESEAYNVAAIPRRALPPIFARYGAGAFYGAHVDMALMGPFPSMRSDLSMTIFLSDPDSYDDGALVLETPLGEQRFKLPAGDAILYPTHFVHRVEKITRGERLAVITWIESIVRDPQQREIIGDLVDLMDWAVAQDPPPEVVTKLEKTRLNLLRMWANT